jgi:hypothetical protein
MVSKAIACASVLTVAFGFSTMASAENFVERSAEHRFQLDFHVPEAALQKMLPQGWEPVVATAGPAKDANLRVIFIDRIGRFGADGKPLPNGPTQFAYIAIPVKQTGGAQTGQMIIAGLTRDAADAPGAFGVFRRANSASMQRSVSSSGSASVVEENWQFAAATGEHLQVHVKYQRGPSTKGGGEVKFFDPADPGKYQIFKTEQELDITRNATTNPPDHVMEFSYSVGGGKLANLFDGTEKVLSWDSFPQYDRTVLTP